MQKLNGLEAAAIYLQSDEEQSMGIPPHWKTYFTADNVDAVAEKAGQIGGTVLFGPMDVFEAGRMVMLQDPPGSSICSLAAEAAHRARVKHDPGAITWNELMTPIPTPPQRFTPLSWAWSRLAPWGDGLQAAEGGRYRGGRGDADYCGPGPQCRPIGWSTSPSTTSMRLLPKPSHWEPTFWCPGLDIPEVGRSPPSQTPRARPSVSSKTVKRRKESPPPISARRRDHGTRWRPAAWKPHPVWVGSRAAAW